MTDAPVTPGLPQTAAADRDDWVLIAVCVVAGALSVRFDTLGTPLAAAGSGLLGLIGLRLYDWSRLPAFMHTSAPEEEEERRPVLAVLLWFTISGQRVERTVPVPILYRNLPEGLLITGDRVSEINVHLRGGYAQLSELVREDVNVVIDLMDAQPGQRVVTLRTDQVRAPLGVEVTHVDPATTTVTIERSGTTTLPVEPAIEGQPAAGFVIGTKLIEERHFEHPGVSRRLVGVVLEDVPGREGQIGKLRERDEVLDHRRALVGAFSEPDGPHLGQ